MASPRRGRFAGGGIDGIEDIDRLGELGTGGGGGDRKGEIDA